MPDMGIRVESLAAQNVVERAVLYDAATQQDPQLMRSLARLRLVVEQARRDEFEYPGGQTVESPSVNLSRGEVDGIFSRAKGIYSHVIITSLLFYTLTDDACLEIRLVSFNLLSKASFEKFTRAAHSMFQLNQKLTIVDKVLVYADLSNICSSFSSMEEESHAARFYDLAKHFGRLLLQSLTTFPMFAPATIDTAEALLSTVRLPCPLPRLES